MELNSLLFPAPQSSYTYEEHRGRMVFIPRAPIHDSLSNFCIPATWPGESPSIPCLYLKHNAGSSKLLIYFHGNAEDIGSVYHYLQDLPTLLGFHLFIVEYPGYGIYSGESHSQRILEDAINVYDYIAYECHWGEDNILLMGRSIGTGPALHLASRKQPAFLSLISAYTSIKGVVKSIAGSIAQYLVKEQLNNLEAIKQVHCPTLLIHGLVDRLIPYAHSEALFDACPSRNCELKLQANMEHNEQDFYADIVQPFADFLERSHIQTEATPSTKALLKFPLTLYMPPLKFPQPLGPTLLTRLFRKLTA